MRSNGSPAASSTAAAAAAGRRPVSAAAAVRISATRQSAVGQLRQSALASTHTPLLAFSKNQSAKYSTPSTAKSGAPNSPSAAATEDTSEAVDAVAADAGGEQIISGEDDSIVIHVCDENRGINKDFTCRKDVLLSEMAYFRSYLNGSESCEDIDISVHCDIQIFQWLIKYLNEPASPPSLDTGSVISILISSQFLKMERLVCLPFHALSLPPSLPPSLLLSICMYVCMYVCMYCMRSLPLPIPIPYFSALSLPVLTSLSSISPFLLSSFLTLFFSSPSLTVCLYVDVCM